MDIFFVMSGYLITSLLIAEYGTTGSINYRAFIKRRIRRLLPALTAMLLFCLLVSQLLWASPAGMLKDVGLAATYLTNIYISLGGAESPLSHTWSLSIEEQFYIAWPLITALLVRLSRNTAAGALVCAWLAITFSRIAVHLVAPDHPAGYFSTPLHVTGLLLGSALAFRPVETHRGALALACAVSLMIAANTVKTFPFAVPVMELLTILMICNPPKILLSPVLGWMGKISYGVYLWHIPILWLVHGSQPVLTASLSIVAGALSYYLIEPWTMGRVTPWQRLRALAV